MSFSSETPNPQKARRERLVSEPVIPVPGSFNATTMAAGEPGVPMGFAWRGTAYRVTRILGSKKNLRPCRNGSGEQYINKHFFTVETDSGDIMTLYRTRSGSRDDGWILYTMQDVDDTAVRDAVDEPLRIAVLVSGGGTTLQALIDAVETDANGNHYRIVLVVADREETGAIERAKRHGIPTGIAVPKKGLPRPEARLDTSSKALDLARQHGAQALVLAGFLTILQGEIIDAFAGRIINIHPALLPKFGGPGMWGHHVHEAVLDSGDTESGCTIHIADSGCDTGPILLQKKVPVLPGDTPDSLAVRIHIEERKAIVEGVNALWNLIVARKDPRKDT